MCHQMYVDTLYTVRSTAESNEGMCDLTMKDLDDAKDRTKLSLRLFNHLLEMPVVCVFHHFLKLSCRGRFETKTFNKLKFGRETLRRISRTCLSTIGF